jgi:hypothetical protein
MCVVVVNADFLVRRSTFDTSVKRYLSQFSFWVPFRSENGILSNHDAVRYSNVVRVRPRSTRSSERRHFTGTHDIHLFHADDAAQFLADDRRLLLRANHHFEVY